MVSGTSIFFQVIAQWEESSSLVAKRDEELKELFEKIHLVKEKVKKKQGDLKEQNTFLQIEKGKFNPETRDFLTVLNFP